MLLEFLGRGAPSGIGERRAEREGQGRKEHTEADGGFDAQKGKRAASAVCEQHTAGDTTGAERTAKGATLSKGFSAVNRTCTLKIEYGRNGGNT